MHSHVKRSSVVRALMVALLTPLVACGSDDDPLTPSGPAGAEFTPAVLAVLEASARDLSDRVLPSLAERDASIAVLAVSIEALRDAIESGFDIEVRIAAVHSALDRAELEVDDEFGADLGAVRLAVEAMGAVTSGTIEVIPRAPAANSDVQGAKLR